MTQRYFSQTPLSGDRALLAGPEAHHLLHVMRAKPGDRVVLFDGSGAEFDAMVERPGRNEVELRLSERREVDRELGVEITLGVALPKGERQRWLVEKAVELGVRRLVPLVTERSVAWPVEQALERLRRTVIEASKQCGRNRLMEIARPQGLADYLAAAEPGACRWVAHPDAAPDVSAAGPDRSARAAPVPPRPVYLIVGPEGGLTGAEVELATAAGWRTVDLGPRTLRVETAALVLVTLALQEPPECV
jgi:16S rRNA (uracil1498-N3)-methyltransferase